jgi:hypothetical protein
VGIVEWSSRIRGARSVEMRIAATLGAWVQSESGVAVKLLLARHARHFAWHADLWDGLVPVLHDVAVPDAVTDPRLAGAVAAFGEIAGPGDVYEHVLPHVVATYRAWSAQCTPIGERPVMRVLDLVLRDVDLDAQEGHDLFSRG